jgi:tRNA nucleotidyltransferase (CCA-adding enzyme)
MTRADTTAGNTVRLRDEVLARIRPTAAERTAMAATVARLQAALAAALTVHRLPGRPEVQGSVAKDTWIRGATDIDCFLLMDPGLGAARLKAVAETVGHEVLDDARRRYAQHPYIVGTFEGATVDLVPAFDVQDPAAPMTAVDRTPHHTAWVLAHLDAAARDDVRLAKAWCKGVEVYGAETRVGGFSGYLVEVLLHALGGLDAFLAWLAEGAQPRQFGDAPAQDDAVLVVADPVDANRNCAAAVRDDTLARAIEAARAYRDAPALAFFFPAQARAETRAALHAALATAGNRWLAIDFAVATDRLDIVFPQFQRAARQVAAALDRAGFVVEAHDVFAYRDDERVAMQFLVDAARLDARRTQTGPPVGQDDDAKRFRAKWQGHAAATGPVEEREGRLQVDVRVEHRDAVTFLRANAVRLLAGKHVRAAWNAGHAVLDEPGAASPEWQARASEFILRRRPWERPGGTAR